MNGHEEKEKGDGASDNDKNSTEDVLGQEDEKDVARNEELKENPTEEVACQKEHCRLGCVCDSLNTGYGAKKKPTRKWDLSSNLDDIDDVLMRTVRAMCPNVEGRVEPYKHYCEMVMLGAIYGGGYSSESRVMARAPNGVWYLKQKGSAPEPNSTNNLADSQPCTSQSLSQNLPGEIGSSVSKTWFLELEPNGNIKVSDLFWREVEIGPWNIEERAKLLNTKMLQGRAENNDLVATEENQDNVEPEPQGETENDEGVGSELTPKSEEAVPPKPTEDNTD